MPTMPGSQFAAPLRCCESFQFHLARLPISQFGILDWVSKQIRYDPHRSLHTHTRTHWAKTTHTKSILIGRVRCTEANKPPVAQPYTSNSYIVHMHSTHDAPRTPETMTGISGCFYVRTLPGRNRSYRIPALNDSTPREPHTHLH